jgi:phosphatidylserine/phosphatidylglycerophosphate/cardiolipin synthase-like enzyme
MRFLEGRDLYRQVIEDGIARAERSVWIATANVKELWIDAAGADVARRKRDYVSVLTLFSALAERGVELRLLHAALPSRRFRAAFDRHPRLVRGGLTLKVCPRVHFKAVIVDGAGLYLGSANFTGAGLGAKSGERRNFEMGFWSTDEGLIDAASARFAAIWEGRECASCAVIDVCADPILPPKSLLHPRRSRK